MATENQIDCPALHQRSDIYPFGDRVPRTVRMLKTVTADPMPGIGLAYIEGNAPVAQAGQTYPVWTNSHGAVTAVMGGGMRLGLRPAEFEVDSWHDLAAAPAPQPHPEPIAWMVGTAFWWTKEEAERDAAATGLPIVGLGPMTGDVEAARLTKATAFVQRLVDCAGTQPSVATGYLRDILDELKGNTTPTAPVAHNENASFESWARSRLTPLNLRLDEIGLYHDLVAGTAHDAWQARAALEIKAS